VHATAGEAREETLRILDLYANFAENVMAMPVMKGEKTAGERFPGAVDTYSIEAMMQDRKALQAGTSHFLGQNFAKAQQIKFQHQSGEEVFAWTTSWGVSTRLVGGLIMTHSDDDGLVLPPKLAPAHVVILPIYRNDAERTEVLSYCATLEQELQSLSFDSEQVRVRIDDRDIRGGEKKWQWVKRGAPVRLEIGPRDVLAGTVSAARRDGAGKPTPTREEFIASLPEVLAAVQQALFDRALQLRDENTVFIDDLREFERYFTPNDADRPEIHGGFAYAHFDDGPEMEEKLKDLKVTVRCLPLDKEDEPGKCIFSGRPSPRRGVFAKAY
jgi:prolyl-tRNA synthetase